MEFQRKWRKIDREFQRAAYNSKIQLTVSPGWLQRPRHEQKLRRRPESTGKGGGRLARGRSAAWRSADWQPTAHKTSAGRYTVIPSHALQWCFEYVALHHALGRGRAHLFRVQKQASTHAVSMNACAMDITGICVHPGAEEIVLTRCNAAVFSLGRLAHFYAVASGLAVKKRR